MAYNYIFEWDGSDLITESDYQERDFLPFPFDPYNILPFNGTGFSHGTNGNAEAKGINGFLVFRENGVVITFDSNFNGTYSNIDNPSISTWEDELVGGAFIPGSGFGLAEELKDQKGTFTLSMLPAPGKETGYKDFTWVDLENTLHKERPRYLVFSEFKSKNEDFTDQIAPFEASPTTVDYWDWDDFVIEADGHKLKSELYEVTEGEIPRAKAIRTVFSIGEGKNVVNGSDGEDKFVMDSRDSLFLKKTADRITGFSGQDGDKLWISGDLYNIDLTDGILFGSASSKSELRQLSREGLDFVYLETNGRLFFDGNGTSKNWGNKDEGGLIAILTDQASLTENNLVWVP